MGGSLFLWSCDEVEVLGDPRPVPLEGLDVGPDAGPGGGEVMIVEVEVQEVDVPGRLDVMGDVGLDDLPRDGQRGRLRVVVDVAVTGAKQFLVLLDEESREERRAEYVAGADTGCRVVGGEFCPLLQPLLEDAETDLT